MNSLKTVRPSQAAHYYAADNYDSLHQTVAQSRWLGKEADRFGLTGQVDKEIFQNLLNGKSPDGEEDLHQRSRTTGYRRGALDITLSAPKSVSLAILVEGRQDLWEAHQRVCERVIEYIERHLIQTRVRNPEGRQFIRTGNLLCAQFDHTTSREQDPQIHTHCLILNTTEYGGKRYAIANESIYRNRGFLRLLYHNELTWELRSLGYGVERRPDGMVELAGYPREYLEVFSKRRQQILDLVGEAADPKLKQWACLATRAPKGQAIPLESLQAQWQLEASQIGLNRFAPELPQSHDIHSGHGRSLPTCDPQAMNQAIADAIAHCGERQSAFSQEALLKFIFTEIGQFPVQELEQAIATHPELIQTVDHRYTTQTAVLRELQTIQFMLAGRGSMSPLATAPVETLLEGVSLTAEQREAVLRTTRSPDQFFAWMGVAGAGKSYALQQLQQVILSVQDSENYTLKALAPTGKAASELGKTLGLEGQTLHSFLASRAISATKNEIWIVDEAGLISAQLGWELMQKAMTHSARVILVGDPRQLSGVEAGSFFRSLLAGGIARVHLEQSQRQQNPHLKQAVQLAQQGLMAQSLQLLETAGQISEIPDPASRASQVAADYLKLTPFQRANTLVLAGTHAERRQLTIALREGLKTQGNLIGATMMRILQPKDLTQIQSRFAHHYSVGDVVVPTREAKRLGLQKFQPYRVLAVQEDTLQLMDPEGRTHCVDPIQFRKQVYRVEGIEITVGDKLQWTRTDKLQARKSRNEVVVQAIADKVAILVDQRGKTHPINLNTPQHLDYAWVQTVHAAQGKTVDRVLLSSTVDGTVSAESYYVAISRARQELKLYVENLDFLLEAAQRSKVQENPLELVDPALVQSLCVLYNPNLQNPQQTAPPFTPFYQPQPVGDAPPTFAQAHWQELVEGSGIHPDLVKANIDSVAGNEVLERLLSTRLAQIGGSGQFVTQAAAAEMRKYEQVAQGGWWANAGIDARSLPGLKPGGTPDLKLWGSFKPEHPRVDLQKSEHKGRTEYRKYEHPAGEERGLFLFQVPPAMADRLYARHGVEPTTKERRSGFWFIVWRYNLPITITEGAKKTLSSLSQGEITIGLSGVNGGYFARDGTGAKLERRQLHPELQVFATPGRAFRFAFDQDTKPQTIANVRRDLVRTGELLEAAGCRVNVLHWQGEKGLDDLIVNQGPQAYAQAQAGATSLAREAQKHYRSLYLRLVQQVKTQAPQLEGNELNAVVYQLAMLKGDRLDGARVIAESDHCRTQRFHRSSEPGSPGIGNYIEHLDTLAKRLVMAPGQSSSAQQDVSGDYSHRNNGSPLPNSVEPPTPETLYQDYKQQFPNLTEALRVQAIARQAFLDHYPPAIVSQILIHDPFMQQVRQNLGADYAQFLIAGAIRVAQTREDEVQNNPSRQRSFER